MLVLCISICLVRFSLLPFECPQFPAANYPLSSRPVARSDVIVFADLLPLKKEALIPL